MSYLAYEYEGQVHIVIPVPGCQAPLEEHVKFIPNGVSYVVVTPDDLPQDRTFRNAWSRSGNRVGVDMPKARDIWMNKIREHRDKELQKLDLEYIRADEQNNGQLKQQIAQKKQRLRDIPSTFDLSVAATPEQLKALWPEEVPK